jgi:hypothetical protein
MIVTRIQRTLCASVASLVCITTLAGCSNAPSPQQRTDYAQSLNRYYEGRPMCLWSDTVKFPVEDASPDQIQQRGFEALVSSGLLVRKQASKGAPRGSYTYDLSPEGRSAIELDVFNKGAGNFCYGRRKVTSIDAARRNSPSTDLVQYQYSLSQPAAWASEYAIQRTFPKIVAELSGPHKAEATLLDTTDGWQVSGNPATLGPAGARRNSEVARATPAPNRAPDAHPEALLAVQR